ncbi:MAG: hypothetical protein C5S38_06435 [Candidatus Methanophagaceae archaeon]|jgi:S1-C subfamily serine protease|nr:MAG: hypothetical protein C5S38_06435 [Methanophagales archaeon]
MEIWGFGGGRGRTVGYVNILRKEWRDIDKFWVLRLGASPSKIEPGDSGGPILITRNGRKEVIGINWNSGGAPGGSAAAAFGIDEAGHSNLVSYLMDQIIHEPMVMVLIRLILRAMAKMKLFLMTRILVSYVSWELESSREMKRR